ncbi:SRPBCC family protein [Marinoscillum pacificum]|uniref:SRPBCC family protein n=1 Tax=Marinoscillum pacificum TaxID=392723 RepID=UPI0021572FBF|nr:SRPBCC family protein [Marinoscillum pacificum]
MLNKDLVFKTSIQINSTASEVWDALINPEKIKKYFFGTETKSDWKTGSDLIFQGEWEGTPYIDKGTILSIEPNRMLSYNYISSFSQLKDKPENRATITMEVLEENDQANLTLTQEGFETQEAFDHSASNWSSVLEDLKNRVEKNDW